MTRIGKIARLPRALRNQLNQSLYDGEAGHRLVEWLNALPEAQAVLAAEFEGRAINAQNHTDWKQGGYRDWVSQQEALELAQRLGEEAAELQAEGRPPLTDTLALWLAARYAVATRQVAQTEGAEGWRWLRELCADVVELRRGDHSAERLRLEREQVQLEQQRLHEKTEEELWAWALQPEIQERISRGFKTDQEKLNLALKALFGVVPEEAEKPGTPPADQGKSSPIKPDQTGCD